MDPSVKTSMLEYYNVHADDYDRVYSGHFPGSEVVGADAYPDDTAALHDVVRRTCTGALLDIPCGTAFWLPAYAAGVSRALLVDQSPQMLARARSRAANVGVHSKFTFFEGDILSHAWHPHSFDTLLVAFFLSHTDDVDERAFFQRVIPSLRRGGRIVILDSIWNAQRALSKPRQAVIQRSSTDGRRFDVYKRYFDAQDICQMAARHGLHATVTYAGRAFISATAAVVD